jgi:biliverdin reductase
VAGHRSDTTAEFCQRFQIPAYDHWQALVEAEEVDLVVVATINRDHGPIAEAALQAGKHVVVEYPLALDYPTGQRLVALAQRQEKLLHVEHIELLGGLHQALRQHLPTLGEVFYGRYATLQPQNPAPEKWTYHPQEFGFPLVAGLSRIHRLTDLFGAVAAITCQNRWWPSDEGPYYHACLCQAQLRFHCGLMADILYGKGDVWQSGDRHFSLQGQRGTLIFEGDTGILVRGEEHQNLTLGSRRGLFAQDTQAVLDYLSAGTPLYVENAASLYALQVASAAQASALSGQTVLLN